MTDKLTAAQRADVLEMMAVYHGAPAHVLNQRAKDIRDEAARREAGETKTPRDCALVFNGCCSPQVCDAENFCVQKKLRGAKPDAPPPPADDLVGMLQAASRDDRLADGMLYRRAAIEALRAERDASKARVAALEELLRSRPLPCEFFNAGHFTFAYIAWNKDVDQALAAGGGNG